MLVAEDDASAVVDTFGYLAAAGGDGHLRIAWRRRPGAHSTQCSTLRITDQRRPAAPARWPRIQCR